MNYLILASIALGVIGVMTALFRLLYAVIIKETRTELPRIFLAGIITASVGACSLLICILIKAFQTL